MQSGGWPGFLPDLQTFLMVKLCSRLPPVGPASRFCILLVVSQRAEAKLADVESLVRELNVLNDAVAEYFCEDPATFKLDECCSIFHSFCKRFDAAVQVRNGDLRSF